jgi:hypothetical protein
MDATVIRANPAIRVIRVTRGQKNRVIRGQKNQKSQYKNHFSQPF